MKKIYTLEIVALLYLASRWTHVFFIIVSRFLSFLLKNVSFCFLLKPQICVRSWTFFVVSWYLWCEWKVKIISLIRYTSLYENIINYQKLLQKIKPSQPITSLHLTLTFNKVITKSLTDWTIHYWLFWRRARFFIVALRHDFRSYFFYWYLKFLFE